MQQLRNGKTLVLEPKPEEIEGLSKRFKVETVLHCRVTLTSSGMPGLKNCVKGRDNGAEYRQPIFDIIFL